MKYEIIQGTWALQTCKHYLNPSFITYLAKDKRFHFPESVSQNETIYLTGLLKELRELTYM